MTTNLAVVGAGSIGAKHVAAARAAEVKVGWIVDHDLERAHALATECDAQATDDFDLALRDRSVHGAIIGVPNSYHKRFAIAAMEAGKDVLLEKPMALDETECRQINEVARTTDRIVQLAFVHRYTAVGRLAKRLALEGRLGNIYHGKAHLYFRRGIPGLGKWFTTKELSGGGALIDVGVHLIDLALHILDYPRVAEVTGQVYSNFGSRMQDYIFENMWAGPPNRAGVFDVEDSAHAFVRMESGTTLDLQVAWAGNYPTASIPTSMMGFFGDRGGIAFELFGDRVNSTHEENGLLVDTVIPALETAPFRDQLLDFVKGIEKRKVFGPTGEQGKIVQSIVDGVYLSSRASFAAPAG